MKLQLRVKQDNQRMTEIWLRFWYKNQRTATVVALPDSVSPLQHKYYRVSFLKQLTVPETNLRNSSYTWNKTINLLLCLSAIFLSATIPDLYIFILMEV